MFPRNVVKLSQRSFSTSTKKLWSESPAIHVDPKLGMVDDKVNITIEGKKVNFVKAFSIVVILKHSSHFFKGNRY